MDLTTNVIGASTDRGVVLGDRDFYTSGSYIAYAQPWGAAMHGLTEGVDYTDTITVYPSSDLDGSVFTWDQPDTAPTLLGLLHADSGNFMAENLRRCDEAMFNLLDIGAAYAASGHADQHFPIGNLRHGNVLSGDATGATVNTGSHLERFNFRGVGVEQSIR